MKNKKRQKKQDTEVAYTDQLIYEEIDQTEVFTGILTDDDDEYIETLLGGDLMEDSVDDVEHHDYVNGIPVDHLVDDGEHQEYVNGIPVEHLIDDVDLHGYLNEHTDNSAEHSLPDYLNENPSVNSVHDVNEEKPSVEESENKESEKTEPSTEIFHQVEWNGKRVKVAVSTSVGCVRERNEDNYFADDFEIRLEEDEAFTGELDLSCRRVFAVCDGMGGEDFGDDASEISVGVIGLYKSQLRSVPEECLLEVLTEYALKANSEIWNMVYRQGGYQSGSTLAMAIVDADKINIFNVGDSRVYIYKDKKLKQITEDQTLAMKKLKEKIYTEEEAKNSLDAHRITNFLGIDEDGYGPEVIHSGTFPTEDQIILICSDGLTDMCCDEEIEEVLSEKAENHADVLVDRALINGGVDNVTCIVIRLLDENTSDK